MLARREVAEPLGRALDLDTLVVELIPHALPRRPLAAAAAATQQARRLEPAVHDAAAVAQHDRRIGELDGAHHSVGIPVGAADGHGARMQRRRRRRQNISTAATNLSGGGSVTCDVEHDLRLFSRSVRHGDGKRQTVVLID